MIADFVLKKSTAVFQKQLVPMSAFDIISFLLLRDDFLSMVEMIVFSVKQSWHERTVLL